MTPQQHELLRLLKSEYWTTTSMLVQATGTTVHAVTSALRGLERDGFVVRTRVRTRSTADLRSCRGTIHAAWRPSRRWIESGRSAD